MNVEPLISIITVTYNSAATLQETIDSVRAQSYENIEYIVVDGASTDETLDIIRSNDDIIDQWVSEPDDGIYDAMNKGIRMSNGELIGILNSDDLYLPDAVTDVAEVYRDADVPCVIYGNMTKFDSRGNEAYYEGDLTDAAFADLELQLNHPTCFVARSVYEEHGAFDTWFEIGADRELMLRLYNAEVPRIHVDKTLARFRLGGATSHSTFSDAIWLTWQNWVMYRRNGVFVKRSLQRVVYKLLRRLAKFVLPLERLRETKKSLRGTFMFQIVWGDRKPNSKSSL